MTAPILEILVVDDEVGIRELLSEILQDEGYRVALAENDYDSIFLVVLPSPGPTRIFRLQYGAIGAGAGKAR